MTCRQRLGAFASQTDSAPYDPKDMWATFFGSRQLVAPRRRRQAGSTTVASGCVTAVIVAAGAVGAITWTTDTCTLQVSGYNANATLQGWGSTNACQQVIAQNPGAVSSAFASIVRHVTGGLMNTSTSFKDSTPSGAEICSGWTGAIHYTIRDQSSSLSLDPDRVGKAWCASPP